MFRIPDYYFLSSVTISESTDSLAQNHSSFDLNLDKALNIHMKTIKTPLLCFLLYNLKHLDDL